MSGLAGHKDVVFSNKGITCGGSDGLHVRGLVCWGTTQDNGKAIVWGSDAYQLVTAHTAHNPHASALPPPLAFSHVRQALGTMSKSASRGAGGEPGREGAEAHVAATPAGYYCPFPLLST